MPWQAEREVAQRAFDKKDLRQLRHILAAQRELFDDEVTEIDPEDKPVWDPSPRLFSSRLRETTKLYGIAIPPDSETFYTDSGRLSSVSLGDDTEIYGSCYPTDSIVYFLKDGGLDWVSLSTDTWVKTGRKRSSRLLARKLISFYRNGTFKETTLGEDTTINGLRLPEESIVHYSNTGQLVWVQLAHCIAIPYDKQRLVTSSCLEFHPNGQVRSLILDEEMTIHKHHFEEGVHVHFDMQGNLALAKIHNTPESTDGLHGTSTAVRFERNGEIKEITVT